MIFVWEAIILFCPNIFVLFKVPKKPPCPPQPIKKNINFVAASINRGNMDEGDTAFAIS